MSLGATTTQQQVTLVVAVRDEPTGNGYERDRARCLSRMGTGAVLDHSAATRATSAPRETDRVSSRPARPAGRLGAMVAPLPEPDPSIDPDAPVPDDPGELFPDAPQPLPPAPIEPTPDDPGGDPGGVPEPA